MEGFDPDLENDYQHEPEGWEYCSLCGRGFDDPAQWGDHICMAVAWEGTKMSKIAVEISENGQVIVVTGLFGQDPTIIQAYEMDTLVSRYRVAEQERVRRLLQTCEHEIMDEPWCIHCGATEAEIAQVVGG